MARRTVLPTIKPHFDHSIFVKHYITKSICSQIKKQQSANCRSMHLQCVLAQYIHHSDHVSSVCGTSFVIL